MARLDRKEDVRYLYTTSADGLWVHHYGGNTLNTRLPDGRRLELTQTTEYPWQGVVELKLNELEPGEPFAIRLRIPGWASGASISVNGEPASAKSRPSSYAQIKRRWQSGDVVELKLPMPVRMIVANPRLEQSRGAQDDRMDSASLTQPFLRD